MALVSTVILTPDLAAHIAARAVAAHPSETGGVLLGRGLRDGTKIVIAVIDAGQNSTATRNAFEPDYEWQQSALNDAFKKNPELEYLGDWHSHPGGRVVPSSTDVRLLTTIRDESSALCPDPVMIICGGRQSWESQAFAFSARDRVRRVPLKVASSSGAK